MIAIVDYGLGNIRAFGNIFNRLNIPYFYASSPSDLLKATKIILPGVGAFDYAMEKLNNSGMRETLDDLVLNKKIPVIGICVGMQIMAKSSSEGVSDGLGWIDARVEKFNSTNSSMYPLPHMGWNTLIDLKESSLLLGLDKNPRFYFLHSYHYSYSVGCSIAKADYCNKFSCIVNVDNIYGIQCHPEKSHHNGVTLLKNFAELPDA